MREIIFRAKRKDGSEWCRGFYIVEESKRMSTRDTIHLIVSIEHKDEVDQETVGQYIGIDDRNGIQIFEGDIVKIISDDELAIIEYNTSEAIFEVKYISNNIVVNFSEYLWGRDVEIVGNIHDNPEILEENHEN